MPEEDKITLFAAWLEGNLSPEQQRHFETLCIQDKDFAARVEQANFASMLSETTPDLAPPLWDKAATFNANLVSSQQVQAWWQWQGFSFASFACSIAAIVMVTTGFNLEYSNGRLSAGFATKSIDKNEINTILDARVADYQASNQQLFAQYINAIQTQQQQSNTQLTEYLLSSSRQERREDFAELITFINQQRRDDQNFYARQITDLQQEITLFGQQASLNGDFTQPLVPNNNPNNAFNE